MSLKDSNDDRFIYELSNNYLINENELNQSVENLKTDFKNDQNITVLKIKMDESSKELSHSIHENNSTDKNIPLYYQEKMKGDKKKIKRNKSLILTWENVTVCPRKKKSIFKFFDSQDEENYSWIDKINVFKKRAVEKPIISSNYNSVLKLENQSIESVSSISTSSTHKRKNGKILDNVSGLAKSGECIAIMGASGAGKTTLLNALNFRNSTRYLVSGKIKLNGKLVNGDELSNRCAYIQQDDLFITTLTVKEHLTFMAMLKMGANFSKEQKVERVHEIIREFNLEKCKDTKIGGINNKKGISGGEKRRLSFASEILTDPQILFCDEPTSGLDSNMALMTVQTLSNMANKGKIVVCTIHQPASQVFDKFDKLCLLAEGKVAYFGERESALDFFKSISYECPLKYNPADFYIDILAVKRNKINNMNNLQAICESYEKSNYHQETLETLKQIDEEYRKLDNPYMTKSSYTGKRFNYTNRHILLSLYGFFGDNY